MTGYTDVRFSGGPLYWRKRYGPQFRMQVRDDVQRIEVPGLLGRKGPKPWSLLWRSGIYQRAESARFRWMGWEVGE